MSRKVIVDELGRRRPRLEVFDVVSRRSESCDATVLQYVIENRSIIEASVWRCQEEHAAQPLHELRMLAILFGKNVGLSRRLDPGVGRSLERYALS